MKKEKLKPIAIKSFHTNLDENEKRTIDGGTFTPGSGFFIPRPPTSELHLSGMAPHQCPGGSMGPIAGVACFRDNGPGWMEKGIDEFEDFIEEEVVPAVIPIVTVTTHATKSGYWICP